MQGAPNTVIKNSVKSATVAFVLKPGTVLQDRYEVLSFIGRGASGNVYVCKDRMIADLKVAVKLWHPQQDSKVGTSVSLLKEILNCRRIDHPNVAAFYDCITEKEFYGYSMELVEGCTLFDMMKKHGRIEIEKVIHIMKQVMRGLSAIHAGGLVHRDLKPSNIIVNAKNEIKISDFGIAVEQYVETELAADQIQKLAGLAANQKNNMSSIVGTPAYIAPEYLARSFLDRRSDLYAAGVIAYELVTGTAPYKAPSPAQLFLKKVEEDPIPPSILAPNCPAELNAIIMNLLARDPEERYADARDVERDLCRIKTAHKLKNTPVKLHSASEEALKVSRGPKLNISEERINPGKFYRRRLTEQGMKIDSLFQTSKRLVRKVALAPFNFIKGCISPLQMFQVELRTLFPAIALCVVISFIIYSYYLTKVELGAPRQAPKAAPKLQIPVEISHPPGTPRYLGPTNDSSKSTVIRSMQDAKAQSHLDPVPLDQEALSE